MEPLFRTLVAWRRAGFPREDLWDLPIGASRTLPPEAAVTGAGTATGAGATDGTAAGAGD
ncbi:MULTISPECIES: hypothetical protein [unclassified Streptomyces]|uniref:hypothetical protein n=1 Tax=unclassified Streptomyces TaxID=2593676 RepID=UPI002E10A9C2|nr:hypothetical protein OG457_10780 [Streptomyces sp. NBC_01207]WTA17544.1 hypothetical protein OG365_05485 [Streptomyces sp. NBC_00853]